MKERGKDNVQRGAGAPPPAELPIFLWLPLGKGKDASDAEHDRVAKNPRKPRQKRATAGRPYECNFASPRNTKKAPMRVLFLYSLN